MATHYKVLRKSLGKRTLPPVVDKLAEFVRKQAQGSLGWFEGFTIELPSGSWAQRIPEQLRTDGIVIALLPDGDRLVLVRAGEQAPVVLVNVDGGARLVATSIEAFAAAWASGTSGVPTFDHDGSRVVEYHGRSATTQSVPSARKALRAWMRAQRIKPRRGDVFDLGAYLGTSAQASDGTIPSAPRSLQAGLIEGKRTAFADYAKLVANHGHPIAEVIAADVAALAEPKGKRTAKLHARATFLAYVKNHLTSYARIAPNMKHFTEPAFPSGMGFRYGFLEELDTFGWTPAMVAQVPALLADDHARWARDVTPRGMTFTELDVFAPLRALRRLVFRWSKIGAVKSLAPLAELRALIALDVQRSAITDLSPLRKLPIVQLKIMETPLVDLSPLAKHPTLEHIDLGGTRVSDVRPLMTCPRLVNVDLWDAKVSNGDAAALVTAMKKRKTRPTSDQTYLIDGYSRGVTHNEVMWV